MKERPCSWEFCDEEKKWHDPPDEARKKNDGIRAAEVAAAKPRKLKWKEERELEGMEAAILAAENEVARIEALVAEPDFYATHAADYAKFEADLRNARDQVARLYARWAELGEVAGVTGR